MYEAKIIMLRRFVGGMLGQGVAVVAVLAAASSVTACWSETNTQTGTEEPAQTEAKSFQDATIPMDTTTAGSNGTAIVNDLTFAVPSSVLAENASPAALAESLAASQSTSISFTNVSGASGEFSMSSPTLSGKLKIASCTFTVTAPANLAGSIFIKSCAVKVSASGVAPGGGSTQGTATLVLNGVPSAPVDVPVALSPGGALIVGGHPTEVTLTGTSGG